MAADLRIGERGSARVAGFDFGNSPTEILAANVSPGTTVALSTTNGTRVLEAAAGSPAIYAAAFVNAGAMAEELAGARDVTVIGCGWEGGRASEDEDAAGAILHRLEAWGASLDARAGRVVEGYLRRPAGSLRRNSAARRLKRLGYEKDLQFCLSEDTVPVVPRLLDGVFVRGQTGRRISGRGAKRKRRIHP